MMANEWTGFGVELHSPAMNAQEITPADGSDLAFNARSLYVGGAGSVKVTTVGGDTVTFVGVLAGTVLPVLVRRVFAAGTTATSIVGLR